VDFRQTRSGRVIRELFISGVYTALIALLIVALVLISGESFHENFGILLRIVLAPIWVTGLIFGQLSISWFGLAIIEFIYLFAVVAVSRIVWHLSVANDA
jgi:hypothetical protein